MNDLTLTKREENTISEPIYMGAVNVKLPDGNTDVDEWIECLEEAKLKAPEGTTFVILARDRGAPLCFEAYRNPTQEERDRRRDRIIKAKHASAQAAVKREKQRVSDLELMLELASRNPMCFNLTFLHTNGIEY